MLNLRSWSPCWRQTRDGHCEAILLSGEAGIGKSRLIAELEQRLEQDVPARLRFFCSPDQTDTPLHPVIAALRREAHFTRGDSDAERLCKPDRCWRLRREIRSKSH